MIDEPMSTSSADGADDAPASDGADDAPASDELERTAEPQEPADAAEADEATEQVLIEIDGEDPVIEAAAEAVVIAEAADELADRTLEGAADEADALEVQGDHEAAESVAEQGIDDAAAVAAAGEAAAERVMDEAVIEAPAEPAAAPAVAAEPEAEAEAETEAPPSEQEVAEAEKIEAAAARGDAEEQPPASEDPFGGPGEWYVVHTYAGYENKVKTNLESRIHTMQMEDKIFRVHIPMEDVMEIKSGKKQVVQKKVFPGYLLVKMWYDNDSWYVVRNTPGVTGFVSSGTGSKPTPLSKREIEKILVVKKEEVKPQFRLGFEEGDVVRIISGPFADFNGTINEINMDQSKLKVLVNIFDRETPVELGFDQVSKV